MASESKGHADGDDGYGAPAGDDGGMPEGSGGSYGGESGGDGGDGGGGHWGYGGDDYVEGEAGAYEDEGGAGEEEDTYDPEGDLPMFANKANKELDAEIRAREARLAEVVAHTSEHEERVRIMEEHLKNVQQELAHTQQLVDAKNKEISTEDHLKQLAEREAGRVRQELTKLETKAEAVQDEMNIVQNHIFKGTERLDRFKLQMNWNQEELEQWALAARQKEEDNLALEKYTRADEARIKELTLQIEKVTKAVAARRVELDEEVTETQAKQIELDKTAEEFRQLHAERQQLVRQWQEAIEAMRRRDDEIAAAGERFAQAKADIEEKQAILQDHVEQLKQQQNDNVETESKIAMRERGVARLREEFQNAGLKLTEFRDEVEVMKNELQKAASDLMTKRSENVTLNGELERANEMLEQARKRYASIKRQLETAMRGTDDVEAVAQMREDELKGKETDLTAAEKELRVLKESMFRQSTELFKLRQEESNLIAEISGAQAASKNLSAKIHKLDQQSLQQQELVYNAEFQIQQLERRVARASGERSDAERKVLNARIEALQKTLEEEKATEAMLIEQVKRVEDDFRATQRKQRDLTKELERMAERMDEMTLANESAEALMKSRTKEKEEVMVQHDVLKLEVRKLRDALSARADEVYGLSNRKFQLEMSMEERKREISVHRDVQRGQLKVTEEERHKVAMELQERKLKVEKLKAKFETLAKATTAGDDSDDDGEEHTQAYYVIKAAQKREELQREGDELDGLIRKAEREIRALENTLKHLNVRNTEYRASFHKADLGSREAQQARNLEEQVKTAKDALFRKKKELQRMQTDLEEDRRRVAQLDEQIASMESHIEHLSHTQAQVEREEAEQRQAIEKAARRVEQLSTAHRVAAGVPADSESLDEKAFMAQAVRDTNNNVLFTLGQLAREFPELQGSLASSIQRYGLHMPSRPPSRAVTADMRAAAGSRGGAGGAAM